MKITKKGTVPCRLLKGALIFAAVSSVFFASESMTAFAEEELKVPEFQQGISENDFNNNAGPGVEIEKKDNSGSQALPQGNSASQNQPDNEGKNYKIYVSKKKMKLTLFEDGKPINQWDCTIGANSAEGDKEREGDKRTPEGKFYICVKNEKSVCYLSLGLSYPSIDDAQRGVEQGLITEEQKKSIEEAIKNKQQPNWYTPLGGEIMIHGGYVKGQMTRGCVAVPNEVMDILWQYAQVGTEVEIGQ